MTADIDTFLEDLDRALEIEELVKQRLAEITEQDPDKYLADERLKQQIQSVDVDAVLEASAGGYVAATEKDEELPVTELQEKQPPVPSIEQVYVDRHQTATEALSEHLPDENLPYKDKLLRFINNVSLKDKITTGLVCLIVVSGVGYFNRIQARSKPVAIAPTSWDEKSYFLANSPLTMTQAIKGQASTDVYKAELSQKIVEWDKKVNESLTANLKGAIEKEAVRLRNEAQKEVNSGVIVVTDRAQQVYDISQCSNQTLQPVKCVLMRYAVEGVDQMTKGDSVNDAAMIAQGWMRYRSAMRALAGSDLSIPNTGFVFVGTGIDSQIKAMRELLTINPQAPIKTQPVQNIPTQPIDSNIGVQAVQTEGASQ